MFGVITFNSKGKGPFVKVEGAEHFLFASVITFYCRFTVFRRLVLCFGCFQLLVFT